MRNATSTAACLRGVLTCAIKLKRVRQARIKHLFDLLAARPAEHRRQAQLSGLRRGQRPGPGEHDGLTTRALARRTGLTLRQVKRVAKLAREAPPALIALVVSGQLSVRAALAELAAPRPILLRRPVTQADQACLARQRLQLAQAARRRGLYPARALNGLLANALVHDHCPVNSLATITGLSRQHLLRLKRVMTTVSPAQVKALRAGRLSVSAVARANVPSGTGPVCD